MYTSLLVVQSLLIVLSIVTIGLIKKTNSKKQVKIRDWSTISNLVGTYAILCINLFFIDPKGGFTPSVSYILSFFNLTLCLCTLFLINLQALERNYRNEMKRLRSKDIAKQ